MPDVYADGVIAGAIESRLGETAFLYDPAWLQSPAGFPLSLSMPLSAREWGPGVILPWLMNLLPEGAPLRALTRALGASAAIRIEKNAAKTNESEPDYRIFAGETSTEIGGAWMRKAKQSGRE